MSGYLPAGDPVDLGLIFLATFHGIAALANGGLTRPQLLEPLIDHAVTHFLRGAGAAA